MAAYPEYERFLDRLEQSGLDVEAERLRLLAEEVNRIASSLSKMDVAAFGMASPHSEARQGKEEQLSANTVRKVIAARKLRARVLPAELFAEPAWDILLDLLHAELTQQRVPVASLCEAAAVPSTTALRWIKTLTDRGMLLRRPDPFHSRRVFVELSRATSESLRRYFAMLDA